MKELEEGQIYAVGGGFFEAKRHPETDQWQLWTHQGLSGHVIGRVGFNVGDDGRLYDRVFDFETEEIVVWPESSYSVEDLEVDKASRKGLARLAKGTIPSVI